MATPRNDSYEVRVLLALAGLVLLAVTAGFAVGREVSQAPLLSGGDSSDVMDPQEARTAVVRLRQALAACYDDHLAGRIRYHIGLTLFKAGLLAESRAAFEQAADAAGVPELIQACSLNMAGQAARLQGENAASIDAFGRLADLAGRLLADTQKDMPRSTLHQLWCAALISRAEIYEVQKDFAAAATEYERVVQTEAKGEPGAPCSAVPYAVDRLSLLHLQQGRVDEYLSLASALAARHPGYERTGAVELESTCVRLLRGIQPELEYPRGALDAPVRLVSCLRQSDSTAFTAAVLDAVGRLCDKHRNTAAGALLDYHHAWMLDAAGRHDDAIGALARVSSTGSAASTATADTPRDHQEILRVYAVIQHALMLAETTDYNEALKLLATLAPDPEKEPHPAQLVESVTKCIQTLKREVPRNAI